VAIFTWALASSGRVVDSVRMCFWVVSMETFIPAITWIASGTSCATTMGS